MELFCALRLAVCVVPVEFTKGSRLMENRAVPRGHVGISFRLCLSLVAHVLGHPRGGFGS